MPVRLLKSQSESGVGAAARTFPRYEWQQLSGAGAARRSRCDRVQGVILAINGFKDEQIQRAQMPSTAHLL